MSLETVAPTSAKTLTVPGWLGPRERRIAKALALVGYADPSVGQLAEGIRAITRASFARHVEPLLGEHWPAVRTLPFYTKLRIGACDLYASAPYTVLFCAPRQPPAVRAVTAVGTRLPVGFASLARLGNIALGLIGRHALQREHRSIVLIASFIMVVDHVLDHCMSDPPRERGARLWGIIEGTRAPDRPELALTRALAVAMEQGLDEAQSRAFRAAMRRLRAWIDAEVAAMCGEPDPTGLGHRLAGVEGGIDGLLFPVVRYAGEGARRWMYDVSLFMQIVDDWFDAEIDAREGRPTPVLSGEWRFADVEKTWLATVSGLDGLVQASGATSLHWRHFVREAYVLMLRDVIVAMAQRPDL